MSGSMGDMGNLLKQAQRMQQEIDRIRAELRETEVEGASADGRVRAKLTGELQVRGIEIAPELVAEGKHEAVEAGVLAALRDAATKAEELRQRTLSSVTGGMNLPGLF